MPVTIVDYNAGNLRSVQRACAKVGVETNLCRDPEKLLKAERAIFPGVGNAQAAMETLKETGLDEALCDLVQSGRPVLGICVGAQLILDRSEESEVACLGLIRGSAQRFQLTEQELKVPHIGWNGVSATQPHPLLAEMDEDSDFYFVHSYYPNPASVDNVYATTDYGRPFCCALGKDNLFATQFHPEKSGRLGLELLHRFSTWDGQAC